MADGMDKAFFVSTSEENIELALDTLWTAATVFPGEGAVELGVVPLPSGSFLILARQPGECVYWRVTAEGELRLVPPQVLVRCAREL